MKELSPQKIFVQYRNAMQPYEPVAGRKYTITHSDITADLFVFIADTYAEDQVTDMQDEVRVKWAQNDKGLFLIGSVIVDAPGVSGNPDIRYLIFYREMPTALQALRQADRFLFEQYPVLDNTPVYIRFLSDHSEYNNTYDFGAIGNYKLIST